MEATGAREEFKYSLTGDDDEDTPWGFAHDCTGLFTPLKDDHRLVDLRGCAPEGGLLAALDRVGGRDACAGNAYLTLLDAAGATMGSYFVGGVTVTAVKPSALSKDLFDVTVRLWCQNALPGSAGVWELIRTGQLNRNGLWRSMGPAGRLAWLSVAMLSRGYRHRIDNGDRAPGHVFRMDGRQVVDVDSFYCALGEAVDGPGGYFGWNLDALDDCLGGGWGASPPFTLEWQHSEVARTRLVRQRALHQGTETLFEVLLEIFADHGVKVVLQ
ncbi:barstar family protein [Kitasatospora sp. NPDC048545]|uniref:barstar family protein n=1 Tax=Kitasatospora sp. NPDC048545 TaxID=3157208 RepID=UPI003403D8BE